METKDKREGWLADLKEGDCVLIKYLQGFKGHRYKQAFIQKITPSGKMDVGTTEDHQRFNEYGAKKEGSGFFARHENLVKYDQKTWDRQLRSDSVETLKYRISEVIDRREHIEWDEKDLFDIWAILKKYHKEK